LLAVARDLGDLHPSAVDEKDRRARVAGQVDHLPAAHLLQLDPLDQAVDGVVRDFLEKRDLFDVPERTLLVLHGWPPLRLLLFVRMLTQSETIVRRIAIGVTRS